jgi:tripartite ATP-independent transporter DctP family solute receptor
MVVDGARPFNQYAGPDAPTVDGWKKRTRRIVMDRHLGRLTWRGALVAVAGALALGMALPASAADFTLNVNTALTTDDPMYIALESFKKGVEARSNKRIEVKLFPSSQLGKDEDVLEQARAGGAVAVLVDGGRLAPFVKELGILGAPYVAKDYAELRKIVTSPMFEEWVGKLRTASGHQILSFNWFQGQRHVLTNKPVSKPADLAGVRMRTPGAPVWLETVRALGATPTPLPWTEVYSAMQLKAIDALEAQHPAVWGSRLYEVVKHITKTAHINLITGLVGSRAWFDKLPADLQKVVREEALRAGDEGSKGTIDSLAKYEQQMKEKGVTIAEVDLTPFREAARGVYEKLGYADLKKQVDAILAK